MKRRQINHHTIATLCRANPGQWHTVGEYGSTQSAHGAAYYIRAAVTKRASRQSAWAPAGAYEARYTLTEFGARVEARYIGDSRKGGDRD